MLVELLERHGLEVVHQGVNQRVVGTIQVKLVDGVMPALPVGEIPEEKGERILTFYEDIIRLNRVMSWCYARAASGLDY